ncbi:MAG: S10 family serine carboxypeptidase-like protein [Caldimonas sp.]
MRAPPSRVAALLLAALLAACGGGGSGGEGTATVPPGEGPGLSDSTPYSSAAGASLASADERAAVTTHRITLGATAIDYVATAGHLSARAPVSGTPEASMFYVAYTVPVPAGTVRPIVYFYNGGPGSATVWLHLGSFAPRRVVTSAPSLTVPQPFQLVDNAESLIDVADLVFVDAVGSGYSEAIAPFTNQSFWSVDSDAGVMRDFIARYAAVNQRQASPTLLFGESYGTTRSAVLSHLMVAAGMRLDGIVLQSSILDYNANCDVFAPATLSCEGSFPSYGMAGAWFSLTRPVPADGDAYAGQLRAFAASSYGPAATAWVQSRQPAPAALLGQLVDLTGAPLDAWTTNVDLDAATFRSRLIAGKLLGRYDARIAADTGSALAAGGDPSSTLITGPFTAAARSLFVNELQYTASANYTLLSNAVNGWDFSHDGRALPDTIPDLAAAMTQRPTLRTLSLAGYHDLATPFRQTELDVARLGARPGLTLRVYPGGHMTYLEDGSRVRIKAEVAAFVAAAASATPLVAEIAPPRSAVTATARALPSPDMAIVTLPEAPPAERSALAQGGDPYLPPALRVAPREASPRGAALQALVERKIAERRADVYR